MSRRIPGASRNPTSEAPQARKNRKENTWVPARSAPALSPAPVCWATRVEPAIWKPIPNDMNVKITGQATVGAERASVDTFPSQKASIRLYSAWKAFDTMTGQARTTMVFRIGPSRMRSRNSVSFPYGVPVYLMPVAPSPQDCMFLQPEEYPIQAAVDAASPGDVILIPAGTYPEGVEIMKPVRLRGIGEVQVGSGLLEGISIRSGEVHVDGIGVNGKFLVEGDAD